MKQKKKFIGVILARGGSKGIKNKNLINVAGKPLLYWSLKDCINSKKLENFWVSSDSHKILNYAKKFGAKSILRPKKISNDKSSSEEGWAHAITVIEKKGIQFENVLGIQATSPIRGASIFDNAINLFIKKKYDSMFSATVIKDHFIWHKKKSKLFSNYDYKNRLPRQYIKEQYLENGSFFIFKKNLFKKNKCRMFGKIGVFIQPIFESFQIDESHDIPLIESIIKYFKNKKNVKK
ncbi:acylneuraminate cytidylyltransferase family protein [Candidatus Pelagibacter bacterium]|jgi:N-acylneuraminate cytidylyltransferase|nr:acylneuraminate cytidylyltransferase family protein [Candidatus Pelagibacter bacterium]MDA8835049.1 acylneuraminate cytidylyltransferase family protein [Candidatus Pelagibacter bacterium]